MIGEPCAQEANTSWDTHSQIQPALPNTAQLVVASERSGEQAFAEDSLLLHWLSWSVIPSTALIKANLRNIY